MILLSQNSSRLTLSCRHLCGALYGLPRLEDQMSASRPLDFLRSWYNVCKGNEMMWRQYGGHQKLHEGEKEAGTE